MSLTMQHIISDAQTLCTRLKDHESLADRLISQAQSLYKQVDAMKQYEEEVSQLNEVAHQKPRDALVQGIQQENRHLRELQQENKELRNSLEEHQNTLEIVMSNYRKQVTQLMEINKSDRQAQRSQNAAGGHGQSSDPVLVERQSDKIREMALVMRRAVELDEQSEHRAQEAIAQLTRENKGLRELLRVAYSYNGDLMPTVGVPPAVATSPTDADSSGSLSDSPCSQTIRRRTSADGPAGTEAGFQTVRRRLPAAGKAGEKPAAVAVAGTAGTEGTGQQTPPAPATPAGSPQKAPAEVKSPLLPASSPPKIQMEKVPPMPAGTPPKSPAEGKAPPVPSSSPPKVPALAARVPTVTVKVSPVAAHPAAPAQAAAASTPPPAPAAPPVGGSSPVKSGSPAVANAAPEAQSSPQKVETVSQPAPAAAVESKPAAAAQAVSKPTPTA